MTTAAVAVTAAAAAARADEEATAPAKPAATTRLTSSGLAAINTNPMPSVLAFPVGNDMPEGRWASACSLNCILPGVNATRTVMDQPFDIGADVCVAHVDDKTATTGYRNATEDAASLVQEAVTELETKRSRSASRWPDPVVKYNPHAAQEGTQPHCATGSRLVDGRPWWPAHPKFLRIAKDDAADAHRQLVADEAIVFGAMAMGRNVLGGAVHRQVGVYDLMAVSVQRLGVCANTGCRSVVAVDTTRPSVPVTRCTNNSAADAGGGAGNGSGRVPAGCSLTSVPIITHVGPDGVERPVHMASSELLSLGRGMLGSPHWFDLAPKPFHLGGQLTLKGPTLLVPGVVRIRISRRNRIRIHADAVYLITDKSLN